MTDAILAAEYLREDIDVEAKKAGGRDGKGALPRDIWETYSAFANTDGGMILLGVAETETGDFLVTGLEQVDRVLDDFWNQLNNPQKVSRNLLSPDAIRKVPAPNGRWVVEIDVPRAPRKQRPVFINGNPLTGTFQRRHTGDYRCREDEVRRMLAEQMEDARDARLLSKFDFNDIDMETFRAYRNRLGAVKPDHPFNNAEDQEFMRQIGGWGKDRQTGEEGLTLAGLLMFGKDLSIREAAPNFFLDYRELPPNGDRNDWIDRLTPDGTWAGNLFNFYGRAILRLFRDLKVPFKLELDQRQDETPMHKALRETLINAIIHSDYAARTAILVLKAPDYFEFRNPGRMRISIQEALAGGKSDCRNRNLQNMFALIGLGEKAGSGIPRVVANWESHHYRPPELMENPELEYTLLRLRTVSLLPEDVLETLRARFGTRLDRLSPNARLALATAQIEGFVSNGRLQQITRIHPSDITRLLKELVDAGMLESDGKGRGTTYRIGGAETVNLARSSAHKGVGTFAQKDSRSEDNGARSVDNDARSVDNGARSEDNGTRSEDNGPNFEMRPLLPENPESDERLLKIAAQVRKSKRARVNVVRTTIQNLCTGHFLTLNQIAKLLNRSTVDLRQRFIKPMIEEGLLERRFPRQPNHERQAYRTRE